MIYFNDKEINPKFNNVTLSRVMYNNKKIYPSSSDEVYILDTDGLLYKSEDWDVANNNKAVGVAIISDKYKFVISKVNSDEGMDWGINSDVPGCFISENSSTAIQDFNGKNNTNAIISALGTDGTAANYCRSTPNLFPDNRQGYLPSLGELKVINNNKAEVEAYMSLIGGDNFRNNNWYWSSSLYDSSIAWYIRWDNGEVIYEYRINAGFIRAIASIE